MLSGQEGLCYVAKRVVLCDQEILCYVAKIYCVMWPIDFVL